MYYSNTLNTYFTYFDISKYTLLNYRILIYYTALSSRDLILASCKISFINVTNDDLKEC